MEIKRNGKTNDMGQNEFETNENYINVFFLSFFFWVCMSDLCFINGDRRFGLCLLTKFNFF